MGICCFVWVIVGFVATTLFSVLNLLRVIRCQYYRFLPIACLWTSSSSATIITLVNPPADYLPSVISSELTKTCQ